MQISVQADPNHTQSLFEAGPNTYRTAAEEYTKLSRICPGASAEQKRRPTEEKAKTDRNKSEEQAKNVQIFPKKQ